MKKITFFIIFFALIFVPESIFAKDIYLSEQVIYRGKAKKGVPSGAGSLIVVNKDASCYDVISGEFADNVVSNGKIIFSSGFVFTGEITYSIEQECIKYRINNGTLVYYLPESEIQPIVVINYSIRTPLTIARKYNTFNASFSGYLDKKMNCALTTTNLPGKDILIKYNLTDSNVDVYYQLKDTGKNKWRVDEKYTFVNSGLTVRYLEKSKELNLSYPDGRWIIIPKIEPSTQDFDRAILKAKAANEQAMNKAGKQSGSDLEDFYRPYDGSLDSNICFAGNDGTADLSDGSAIFQQGEDILRTVQKYPTAYVFGFSDGKISCEMDWVNFMALASSSTSDDKEYFKKYVMKIKDQTKQHAFYCTIVYKNGSIFRGLCNMETDDVMRFLCDCKTCPQADSYFRGELRTKDGSVTKYFNGWKDDEIETQYVPYFAENQKRKQEYLAKKEAERREKEARIAAEKKAEKEKIESIREKYGDEVAKGYADGLPVVGMPKNLFMEAFNKRVGAENRWFTSLKYSSNYSETYYVCWSNIYISSGSREYVVTIDKSTQLVSSVLKY